MNRMKSERSIIFLLTVSALGLSLVSVLLKWEYWVPPVILIYVGAMWSLYISSRSGYAVRKVVYLIFAAFMVLYHGVHTTSFFDIALVAALVLVAFSYLNAPYMMDVFLIEFLILMSVQMFFAVDEGEVVFDTLVVARIALHVSIVLMIYFSCKRAMNDRIEILQDAKKKDARIEAADADMEDFLTNISHELRTPVNVVNGMSEMMIQKNMGDEAYSIKTAGIRLAYQIEDIQDYTECKRKKVILEEDDYMSTSLINDVVTSFRLLENEKNLELIVDLDPSVPAKMHGDVKKLHKIFRHLLENAEKFTKKGGIYVRMYAENTDYGVNLCIEMTDTGIGMDRKSIAAVSEGLYQVNKSRNRSSGGIGLGLFIVYGFAHRMGGFVKIESERNVGTTVRVTIPQKVTDKAPCLAVSRSFSGDILFHVRPDKYKVPRVRDFYRAMATNLASGTRVPLYPAQTVREIEQLMDKLNVTQIFMGQEEYEENPAYFDEMSKRDIVVAVSAAPGFKPNAGSNVLVMPKPLYAYPVIKVLNEGRGAGDLTDSSRTVRPVFKNVRALVVDDEPMNLVVAAGLFREYEMVVETADSGKEAVAKCRKNDYDVVFMDHMMPEMDGVEAMKLIKAYAEDENKNITVIALTANAVSGAREMFMKEGFDAFIAKPINIADFERVMLRVLPDRMIGREGRKA